MPIRSITRRARNDTFSYIAEDSEEPGPVCSKLLTTLQGIQRGKIADPFGWCEVVAAPQPGKYAPAAGADVEEGSVDKLP